MTGDPPRAPRRSGVPRRAFLAATGTAVAGTTAGCGFLEQRSVRAPPLVENRPDAVYYPSHVEGMAMAGTGRDGRYRFAISYSFPHRFWLVNGDRRNIVELDGGTDVHLMLTAWDAETGRVLPASTNAVTVTTGSETPVDRRLWPMLSQNMGVHFGDNVPLAGDGTYEATVAVGPPSYRRTGALAGAFEDAGRTTISFEFSQETLESVAFRRLSDQQGQRGAVSPMQMEMVPVATTPAVEDVPGTVLGEVASGDARLVATRLDAPPEGIEGDRPYLAVSARTPYNRYPLPFMSLDAEVAAGDVARSYRLKAALDDVMGYHYGAVLDRDVSIESLTLDPGAPPQIARHEGYETAFLSMGTETLVPT